MVTAVMKLKDACSLRSEERRVGKEWEQGQIFFFGAPKSLQMVTAALKFKDTCSLKEKL